MNWHSQIHYTQNGNARKLNTPIEIMEKENKTDLRYKLEMDFVSYKIFFISILMLIAKKKSYVVVFKYFITSIVLFHMVFFFGVFYCLIYHIIEFHRNTAQNV